MIPHNKEQSPPKIESLSNHGKRILARPNGVGTYQVDTFPLSSKYYSKSSPLTSTLIIHKGTRMIKASVPLELERDENVTSLFKNKESELKGKNVEISPQKYGMGYHHMQNMGLLGMNAKCLAVIL